jgi:hypothetical protein
MLLRTDAFAHGQELGDDVVVDEQHCISSGGRMPVAQRSKAAPSTVLIAVVDCRIRPIYVDEVGRALVVTIEQSCQSKPMLSRSGEAWRS